MSFKTKFKSVFKHIWLGYKDASPWIDLAISLLPGGSAAVAITKKTLSIVSALVSKAEDVYSEPGSGIDKAALVEEEALIQLEKETGKNFDSPRGRALINRQRSLEVQIRDLHAAIVATAQEIHDYIADVKEPAKDDTTA